MKFNYADGNFPEQLKEQIEARFSTLFNEKFSNCRVEEATFRLDQEKNRHDSTLKVDFIIPGHKAKHFSHHMPHAGIQSNPDNATTLVEQLRNTVKNGLERLHDERTKH